MRRDPRLLAVPVVVVLVVVTLLAAATQPKAVRSAAAQSSVLPIRQANLVCPQVGGAAKGGVSRIAYADAAPPGSGTTDGGSTLTVARLTPGGLPSAVAVQEGHGWVFDGPKAAVPAEVAATGPLTDSLGVVQFSRTPVGAALEAAAAECEGPTADAWFAGFSSVVGAHSTLLLSNVDTVAATVDVSVWGGPSGQPTIKRGIKVDPQSQFPVSLDQLEPGLTLGAVHVVATAGRVVPAVQYEAQNGLLPLGVDWLPRTNPAAVTQIVPGILGGSGSRRLAVANPGDVGTTFSLTMVTADGSFKPTDFDLVPVDAGAVADVNLDSVLHGQDAAVIVSAADPVVVGAVSALAVSSAGTSDVAFTGAVPALTGPTVVPGGEVAAQRRTALVLSAPDPDGQGSDAQLSVTILPALSTSPPVVTAVTIAAGTTKVLDLATMTADPAPAVVVTPQGGGPVYAAWSVQESGPNTADVAELVLRTPLRSLLRPPARFDPAVGLP